MPYLQIKVPVGTANAHTAKARYEEFMQWLGETFPHLFLGPIGEHGDMIQVSPLEIDQLYWLQCRRTGRSIEGFSYHEYSHEEKGA